MRRAHIQALSIAFTQACMYFVNAAAFRYGAYLVGNYEMDPIDVFRLNL